MNNSKQDINTQKYNLQFRQLIVMDLNSQLNTIGGCNR